MQKKRLKTFKKPVFFVQKKTQDFLKDLRLFKRPKTFQNYKKGDQSSYLFTRDHGYKHIGGI